MRRFRRGNERKIAALRVPRRDALSSAGFRPSPGDDAPVSARRNAGTPAGLHPHFSFDASKEKSPCTVEKKNADVPFGVAKE